MGTTEGWREAEERSDVMEAQTALVSADAQVKSAEATLLHGELTLGAPGYGAARLREARDHFAKFAILPSTAALTTATLWAAHTHAYGSFNASPRLAILATEKECGKTRLLELVGHLSANPSQEVDPTGPTLVSKIDQAAKGLTLLIDETDMIWGTHGGNAMRSLRAILNAGYKQGAVVSRRSGGAWHDAHIYCPVAFAGNGILPDTLMSRSVVIMMRKPLKGEHIEPYMPRMHAPLGAFIGEALGAWMQSISLELASAWPDMPEGVDGRAAEIWEPLIAICDEAGEEWPDLGRAACREFVLEVKSDPVQSPGERILRDLRTVWTGDKLTTAVLVRRLFDVKGAPWVSMWSPAQAPRELASLLRPYGVSPTKVKGEDGRPLQGYRRQDLVPVWSRVVPEPVPEESAV